MVRLIDADFIIEVLERAKENCTDLRDISIILMMQSIIDAQPTAYDVEKVVERIHDYFVQKIDDCEEDIVQQEILEYNKEICEIVRKGGVE